MTDLDLIPIGEWCEWEDDDDACEGPASCLLITATSDLEWYCDEHGEIRLEEAEVEQ